MIPERSANESIRVETENECSAAASRRSGRRTTCARILGTFLALGLVGAVVPACAPAARTKADLDALRRGQEDIQHRFDEIAKAVDDLAWYQRVGDVAYVDKWRIAGPPPVKPDPKVFGSDNLVKFWLYSFVPRDRKPGEKLPTLIFPHGGVHADFTSAYAHIIRELMAQGYIVLAPEYRGSTGYGRDFYELIDYGGREVDDVHATRDWAVENLDGVDPDRMGLFGWSHGGLIVLLEAAAHGSDYRCVFAGMPVSDLPMRLGYYDESYRALYTAPYHIGKTVAEAPEEYRRRSPTAHVAEIDIPLRVHTNTNDEDVRYIEVQKLAQTLRENGKQFEYRVLEAAPGGHLADRIDTRLALDSRHDIYVFLAKYLHPAHPPVATSAASEPTAPPAK